MIVKDVRAILEEPKMAEPNGGGQRRVKREIHDKTHNMR